MVIGYTQGVFDMFHEGHLNLLMNAKKQCDFLIVGVNADKLVESYKHKIPVINEDNRKYIVENIKCVDLAVVVNTLDKLEIYQKMKFIKIFIVDDWKKSDRWLETQNVMKQHNVEVVFLPYTKDISSTKLRIEKDNVVLEGN